MTVVPTFPHAMALSPPVRKIWAVSSTVLVFPLVPVSAIHFCDGSLILHAKSISLRRARPAARARVIRGWSSRQPGDTRRNSYPLKSTAPGAHTSNPSTVVTLSSTIETRAPLRVRACAHARPVIPAPATKTRLSRSSEYSFCAIEISTSDPLGVEEAKSQRYTETGNDPEAKNDCYFSPTQ